MNTGRPAAAVPATAVLIIIGCTAFLLGYRLHAARSSQRLGVSIAYGTTPRRSPERTPYAPAAPETASPRPSTCSTDHLRR